MLTNDRKKEIIHALSQRVDSMECPICHNRNFALLDGYINDSVQDDYHIQIIGTKKAIPSIGLVCSNCGFLSQHSLGVLGLLEKPVSNQDSSNNK